MPVYTYLNESENTSEAALALVEAALDAVLEAKHGPLATAGHAVDKFIGNAARKTSKATRELGKTIGTGVRTGVDAANAYRNRHKIGNVHVANHISKTDMDKLADYERYMKNYVAAQKKQGNKNPNPLDALRPDQKRLYLAIQQKKQDSEVGDDYVSGYDEMY